MKRILLGISALVAVIVSIAAFAIAAPFSPIEKAATHKASVPNVAAQYGAPTAPVKPKPKQVRVPAVRLNSAAIIRTGWLPFRFPVHEAGVQIRLQTVISAKVARMLGLKVTRGQKSVVIGSRTRTSRRAGTFTYNVRMTKRVRRALRRYQHSHDGRLPMQTRISLSKDGKTSRVVKKSHIRVL